MDEGSPVRSDRDLSTLVVVGIDTQLGAHYIFPDVPRKTIEDLLITGGLHTFTQLSIVNASGAALVIPTRIIQTIYVDGEKGFVRG